MKPVWVCNPLDNSYYSSEKAGRRRSSTFSHAAQGISFDLNEIKDLLDV